MPQLPDYYDMIPSAYTTCIVLVYDNTNENKTHDHKPKFSCFNTKRF